MAKPNRSPQSKTAAAQSVSLFDVDKLCPGDVILERTPEFTSRAIRLLDRGEYSHALIFLGATTFLEAVDAGFFNALGGGARIISYIRVPIVDPSAWIVLRHPDTKIGQRAANHARNLASKKYGAAAALRSILPFNFKDDPARLFCSQLVAEAYKRAGAILVKDTEPWKITPRLLHEHSVLQPLPNIPIRATTARNIPPIDRDAGYATSATAQDMRAQQNAFEAVQAELTHLVSELQVSPTPGNLSELLALLMQAEARGAHQEVAPMMKALERALEQEGYFNLYAGFAKEAHAALLADLAFAKSENTSAADRNYLARQSAELAAAYRENLPRFKAVSQWHQNASRNSKAPLWPRLVKMSGETVAATQKLIRVAQTVSDQCASMNPDPRANKSN